MINQEISLCCDRNKIIVHLLRRELSAYLVIAGTSFHTSDNDEFEFPDDYTIFILDAEPYKPNDWNHGYSRGVVISKDKNDIIYYVEDW